MIGDPVWGPSFERVYLALTLAFVVPLDARLQAQIGTCESRRLNRVWTCEACRCVWGGHSLAPTAHAPECPLYLDDSRTAELRSAVASRQPRSLPEILRAPVLEGGEE